MPTSTLERTARPRRSRTRSRNINGRPALVISTLKPYQYDLRPACASLICPDCETWVPITGIQANKQKLVPHDTGRAGKDAAVRCQGSNRLVTVNVAFEKWLALRERHQTDSMNPGSRHGTRVKRMTTTVAPPVSKVTPAPPTPQSTLETYETHRRRCTACTGRNHCTDGARLARAYVKALQDEPMAIQDRRIREQFSEWAEQQLALERPAKRAAEWAAVLPAVQHADAQRTQVPAGDAPTEGPSVPLTTLHPTR